MICSKKKNFIGSNGHELLKKIGRSLLHYIYNVPESVLKENFSYHFDILINSPTPLFENLKVIGVTCGMLGLTKKDTLDKINKMLIHCQLLIWIADESSTNLLYELINEEHAEMSCFGFRILKSDLTFSELMKEYEQVFSPADFLGVSCLHVTRNV